MSNYYISTVIFLNYRIDDVDSEGEGDSTLATSLTARQNLEGNTKIIHFIFLYFPSKDFLLFT